MGKPPEQLEVLFGASSSAELKLSIETSRGPRLAEDLVNSLSRIVGLQPKKGCEME
ncbi:MAG: hypothetical protein WBC70_01705 [Candidatus Aminicenantales bacterium]